LREGATITREEGGGFSREKRALSLRNEGGEADLMVEWQEADCLSTPESKKKVEGTPPDALLLIDPRKNSPNLLI